MPKCQYCSAPLPKKSIICEYCGVRNEVDLQPRENISTARKSDRTCPDCLTYLHSIDVGKNSRFIIEQCERCFGLFFDNHELEKLLEESVRDSYFIDHHKLTSLLQHPRHKDRIVYRKCPVCSKIMQRKNYLAHSGVITDVCIEHGVWLDAGEFKQIQEWIALGGKRNVMREELNKKHRHTRAKERRRSNGGFFPKRKKSSFDFDDLFSAFGEFFT